jgi:hypothetical protein
MTDEAVARRKSVMGGERLSALTTLLEIRMDYFEDKDGLRYDIKEKDLKLRDIIKQAEKEAEENYIEIIGAMTKMTLSDRSGTRSSLKKALTASEKG